MGQAKHKLLTSGRERPCPICGREHNNACRMSLDGHMVLCHHNYGGTTKEGWHYLKPDRSGRCGIFIKRTQKTSRPVNISYTHTYESFDGERYTMRRTYNSDGKKDQRWTSKLNCTEDKLLPYRYNENKDSHIIYITEGELKCDRLIEQGIPAISCRKWTPLQAELLRNKHIIILPDCDSTGIGKAKETAELLKQYGKVQFCYLPNIGSWDYPPDDNGLDVYDWLDNGGNVNDLSLYFSDDEPTDPEFNKLLDKLCDIENLEDTAKRHYLLNKLSQSTKIPVPSLVKIYRDYIKDQEATSPISGTELLSQSDETQFYWIENLIPNQTTILLAGDGGCGKTTLLYNLISNCLSNAIPNPDLPSRTANILIIQSDDNISHTKQILRHLQFNNSSNWCFKDKWYADQIPILKRWIEQTQSQLIVIDSLTSINRNSGIQDKDTAYADVLYDLRDLSINYNCTFIVIHHTNKGGIIKGTTAITYASSEVWEIRKPKENENLTAEHRILSITKSRAGLKGDHLFEYDWEEHIYKYHGQWQDNEAYKANDVLEFMKQHPDEWFSAKDLAKFNLCNGKTNNISRVLNDLFFRRKILIRQKEVLLNPTGRPFYRYKYDEEF